MCVYIYRMYASINKTLKTKTNNFPMQSGWRCDMNIITKRDMIITC